MLAVDNGWAAARHWDERRAALDRLIDQAEREGRRIVLLATAPPPGQRRAAGSVVAAARPMRAPPSTRWRRAVARRPPRRARRGSHKFDLGRGADLVWLSDGIDDGAAADFAAGLGAARAAARDGAMTPTRCRACSAPGDPDDKDLTATVRRADATAARRARGARDRR